MSKDPTAYLRRESRAMHTPCVAERDARTLRAAIEYMKSRGLFDTWNDEPQVRFVPSITGLPWNPEAPKRIVAFVVEIPPENTSQSYRRKSSWAARQWQVIGSVQVPHWDYDGCTSEAREAWELADTHRTLDHAARYREQDEDHLWEIAAEVDGLEWTERWAAEDALREAA